MVSYRAEPWPFPFQNLPHSILGGKKTEQEVQRKGGVGMREREESVVQMVRKWPSCGCWTSMSCLMRLRGSRYLWRVRNDRRGEVFGWGLSCAGLS